MSNQSNVLIADFPRNVRGYSTVVVDEFVRQIGERLVSLQADLQKQTERAERLEKALEQANHNLCAFSEKESAIASALVAMEQRRTAVEQENDAAKKSAKLRAEEIIASAAVEADQIIAQAQDDAQNITAEATARARAQEERYAALCAQYDATLGNIRRTLEDQLAVLPSPGQNWGGVYGDTIAVTSAVGSEYAETVQAA
jgi:cell division septum initiation protein DivIVA